MPSLVGKMDETNRSVKVSQTYCQKQRAVRGHALEPVLEHFEAPSEKSACGNAPQHSCDSQYGNIGKPMRILLKLRDGYVKLMNDISLGSDLSGVSSLYGCPGADFPVVAMANSRLALEEQEREIMTQVLQVQLAHSRQFNTAIA